MSYTGGYTEGSHISVEWSETEWRNGIVEELKEEGKFASVRFRDGVEDVLLIGRGKKKWRLMH